MAVLALFPGSFDPFTEGHEAILRRVLPLFDKVVVAVGVNTDKQYMFSVEERMAIIRKRMADCLTVEGDMPAGCRRSIEVVSYSGMTIDLCHQLGAKAIIRGIRTAKDFEYEQTIAAVNRLQDPSIETLLLLADPEHVNISSTLEREKLMHK